MSQGESDSILRKVAMALALVAHFVVLGAIFHYVRSESERVNTNVWRLAQLVSRGMAEQARSVCEPEAGDIVHVNGMGYIELTDPEEHVQKKLLCNHRYEWNVLDLIEQYAKDGTTAVDAGAYIGTHSLVMARSVGPQGRVYAFEPMTSAADQLRRNLELNGLNNVNVVPKALGESPSNGFMKNTGRVSARTCSREDIESGLLGCDEGVDQEAPFEMVRLDDLGLKGVSLVKIDVEGYELGVLKGARQTLEREKPVLIIEVWEDSRRADVGNTRGEVLGYVEKLGYATEQLDVRNFLALPTG